MARANRYIIGFVPGVELDHGVGGQSRPCLNVGEEIFRRFLVERRPEVIHPRQVLRCRTIDFTEETFELTLRLKSAHTAAYRVSELFTRAGHVEPILIGCPLWRMRLSPEVRMSTLRRLQQGL